MHTNKCIKIIKCSDYISKLANVLTILSSKIPNYIATYILTS